MKSYNYQRISDLITPLMDMMREEYPKNAELVITSDFAKIQYTLTDMAKALGSALGSFLSRETEEPDDSK